MFKEMNKRYDTVREGLETADMEFKALKEFCGKTISVDGYYFSTKGKYGKQVVVVGNGYKINMPKRYVEEFEEINADNAKVKAILEGHLKLGNIHMINTQNGDTVVFDYIDC